MRPRTPSTPGGALRRATGALVLVVGLGVLLAACAATTPRPRALPEPSLPPVPRSSSSPTPTDPTPPVGRPARIAIGAIGVDAPVVPVGLRPDGAMQTPERGRAGWYDLGPPPGAPGAAVVTAHVDSTAGPDVFHQLHALRPGDMVAVRDDAGVDHRFRVTRVDQFPKTRLPVDQIWNDPPAAGLRLITCGGAFDPATGHYRDNIIVWARGVPTGS